MPCAPTDLTSLVCGIVTFAAASAGYIYTRTQPDIPITQRTADLLETTIILTSMKSQDPVAAAAATTTTTTTTFTQNVAGSASEATLDEQLPAAVAAASAVPPPPERRLSLKRKRTEEDQEEANAGYPHNLTMIYPPKKRSKSPTSDGGNQVQDIEQPLTPEPTPAAPEETKVPEDLVPTRPSTPRPSSRSIGDEPKTPLAFGSSSIISTPASKTTPGPRTSTSRAFAAFAGSVSPFASTASMERQKPAWMSPNKEESLAASKQLNETSSPGIDEKGRRPIAKRAHVLEAALTAGPTVNVKNPTGEENEDVELELKGVKLFTKRGEKPFSDGLLGHVKLLSHRETLDERLLFRREPLWQVSMNTRLHPSMKCALDKEEKILRIITQEPSLCDGGDDGSKDGSKLEVVIYALKPGRSCSKQDFLDFATSLMESHGLKAH